MPSIVLTPALEHEYVQLFNTCTVRSDRSAAVQQIAGRLIANRPRYFNVGNALGIPWSFIAVIHNMESGMNFSRHLHNGDPLTARTVQVPTGRPRTGNPPFTWEQSASDALSLKGLGAQTDWSLAGTLYELERYNGWGYRLYHPYVLSPYLWSFSDHYASGKYIADGRWSDTAVSQQCGAAVLLRRLAEIGAIEFLDQPAPAANNPPLIMDYTTRKSRDPELVMSAETLQRWLNTFHGIFVKVDGIPGDRTSEAYKKVTGAYLAGRSTQARQVTITRR